MKKEEQKKPTAEELLEKSRKPAKEALRLHPYYHGKVQVMPKAVIRDYSDFGIWYTPGVAAPCREIQKNPDLSFEHTNRWNYVAVVSDGTRVLGLGDIGPEAAMPVMEGKALLFKYLGGVDAFPICLGTKDPSEIVQAAKWLEPTFGGINLEDIEKPKCFHILEKCRERLNIPVWHDDQQGTATVVLAGLINALKLVGKKMDGVLVSIVGVGAANTRTALVLTRAGVTPGNIVMVDSKGILDRNRADIEAEKKENPWKWDFCLNTNATQKTGDTPEALKDADVCIAASKPGPGTIKTEWIARMADDAIVLSCANPVPEIFPWEAMEAGAKIYASGRSDFEGYSQVNNSLGFPGIFRGVLDVRSTTVTDDMCIAAANALAKFAEKKGLSESYIIPTMADWEVYVDVAVAAGIQSMREGVARLQLTESQLRDQATSIIANARKSTDVLMREKLIPPPPAD